MKKGFYAILAALTVFALAMTGCPTDGDDPDPGATTYTVTFDKNGGTTEANPKTVTTTAGGTVTLPATNPGSPAGKQFGGWNTQADGKGADFTATTLVIADITVYAQWVDFDPTPALGSLADASYEKNTTVNVDLRINVTNATEITADGGALSYQWYKAADATSDGTTTGTNSRDYTPAVNAPGTTYYWVVVTNSKGGQTATSNRAAIIIFVPSGDSAIEKITAANAAMPLWEFALPSGASWADYEEFSIEYYVSKDSRIVQPDVSVRSRAYGAYLASDFGDDTSAVVDQGNINGWGGFRMIYWNKPNDKMTTPGRADKNIHPNNHFIIDNSKGTAAAFGALFTAEGGGASKWFTVRYTTNGNRTDNDVVNDFAKVTLLNSETVDAIYLGAGIFGPGGDPGTNSYEFFVKNPTLLHKSDPTKNIPGGRTMTGTSEKLFAGNQGSAKGATDREVVTVYEDVEGEILISFDLASGTGTFPPIAIMEGESLGGKFPATEPTRDGFKFLGWYDGDNKVDAATTFTAKTTLTAKWESTATVRTWRVNLGGQTTKNATAWPAGGTDNSGLVFKVGEGFNANLYDTVEILCKFYAADGTTEVTDIPASNFQAKWHPSQVTNANGTSLASWWNFGQTNTVNTGPEGGVIVTTTVPAAVKTGGLWGIGIQPSNGTTYAAEFVEVISITFPGEGEGDWPVSLSGKTTKNTTAWTAQYSNGFVIPVGAGFTANLYSTVEVLCKFYAADGTTEVTAVPNGNFQFKWHAVEVENANGANVGTSYNFGATNTANTGPEGGVIVAVTLPDGVKTGGLWGIGIQSSNGTLTAQFVEVISVVFRASE